MALIDEGNEGQDEEVAQLEDALKSIQHQHPLLMSGRCRGMVLGQDEEDQRRDDTQNAIDKHCGLQTPGFVHQEAWRSADSDAQNDTDAAQADNRCTLLQAEPVGGKLGPGVQEERLGDGDANGCDHRQRPIQHEDACAASQRSPQMAPSPTAFLNPQLSMSQEAGNGQQGK